MSWIAGGAGALKVASRPGGAGGAPVERLAFASAELLLSANAQGEVVLADLRHAGGAPARLLRNANGARRRGRARARASRRRASCAGARG
jgi:hypothetical protein